MRGAHSSRGTAQGLCSRFGGDPRNHGPPDRYAEVREANYSVKVDAFLACLYTRPGMRVRRTLQALLGAYVLRDNDGVEDVPLSALDVRSIVQFGAGAICSVPLGAVRTCRPTWGPDHAGMTILLSLSRGSVTLLSLAKPTTAVSPSFCVLLGRGRHGHPRRPHPYSASRRPSCHCHLRRVHVGRWHCPCCCDRCTGGCPVGDRGGGRLRAASSARSQDGQGAQHRSAGRGDREIGWRIPATPGPVAPLLYSRCTLPCAQTSARSRGSASTAEIRTTNLPSPTSGQQRLLRAKRPRASVSRSPAPSLPICSV